MARTPVGYRSPFNKISSVKPSPVKFLPAVGAFLAANPALVQAGLAAAPGVIGAAGSLFGRRKRMQEQQAARAEMAEARKAFESIEYKNPYAGLENPYAENIYEDLTVDTQSADYLKQQQQQSQANIMQNLKGVAGSSGVAGLAQSLANISSGQAQKASANIAAQVKQNQQLALKGEQLKQKGEFAVDKMKAQGEHWKRKQDQKRTESLYGLSIDRMDAADKARQTARAGVIKGLGQAAAGVAGVYAPGGARAGKLGDDLKGIGSKISGMFGGGGSNILQTTMSVPTGGTVPVVTPTGREITGVGTTDYNFGFGNNQNLIPTGYDAYGNPIFD
jgi:hypothetical protein